jgi:transaldolase
MKFFLDTADITEVRAAADSGLLDGVTTDAGHIARTGRAFDEVLGDIVKIVSGPVLAEVTVLDLDGIINQAHQFADLAATIVVKIPLTIEGLQAVRRLSEEGIKTNVTLCFSPVQALLAAKAGATYISPFVGRMNDIEHEGMEGIREIRKIYDNFHFGTQILVASARNAVDVRDTALIGADVLTMGWSVFSMLAQHPLTDIGLQKLLNDVPRSEGA